MSIKEYRAQLESVVAGARAPKAATSASLMRATAPVSPEGALLATLSDDKADANARLGALAGLKVLHFASPDAQKLRPRLIESLRSATKDPGVRLAALHALTELGDTETRQQLLDGLRDPKKALVPKADAFELLANDQHADAIDVARQAVDDADDGAAVTAALQHLARDPESVNRLRSIVTDRNAADAHRRAAADSLFVLDRASLATTKIADDAELNAYVQGLLKPKTLPKQGATRKAASKPAAAKATGKRSTPKAKARPKPKKKGR